MNTRAPIVIVDVDAHITLTEKVAYAHAQTRQVVEHFSPAFGPTSVLRVATPEAPAKPGEIQLRLLNKPTMDGAIGYHDETSDGMPIAYIFCGLAKSLGEAWTSVASHEVLELLADPLLRRAVMMNDGFWDQEISDRVEQDSYLIDGVKLSNFNLPECFEPPKNMKGVKFDFMGLSKKPNEVRPGGYAQHFDPAKGWVQITNGEMSAYRTTLSKLAIGRSAQRKALMPPDSLMTRIFGKK